jgi:phosphohistidine phosphatase
MAKILYLVRHAKSSWSDMSISDFDRPLNKRGQRDAPEMGRRLQQQGVKPEIILCSPAKRTRETVDLLAGEFGGTMETVRFDERIYEAGPETLLDLIRSLPDSCCSAMLIGHNPSIGWMVTQLADARVENMPTCAVATLELTVERWEETGRHTCRLLDFNYPKRA